MEVKMAGDVIYGVLEWTLGVLPTGDIRFEIGYAASPEDAVAERTQSLLMAMTVKQTLVLAEDLRKTAASSRQTPDGGTA